MSGPQPEEDDELLWLLGMICVKWAQLENTVDTALLAWMGSDPLEYIAITAHMPTKERFDAARSLIDLRLNWSEINDELKRLAGDLSDLTLERNLFIHGHYVQSHKGVLMFRARSRGKLSIEMKPAPRDEMRKLISNIVRLQEQIRAALERANFVLATR
jgi:hypothetical protein